jgi:type IV pilus assembly protein PilY1
LVELDVGSGSKLSYPVLDTNGDGKIDDKDSIVSGLNINDGLPGSPVIIDSGSSKASQTKIILLSTGVTKTLDEFDPNPPCQGEKCDEEEAGEFSKRIMWRQLQ